jgi:hypothetical protein
MLASEDDDMSSGFCTHGCGHERRADDRGDSADPNHRP